MRALPACLLTSQCLVCCRYDGTVRNSVGDVIQFLYGEDGMDGAAIESQTMEHLRWDKKKLEVKSLPPCLQSCLMAQYVPYKLHLVTGVNEYRVCALSFTAYVPLTSKLLERSIL